MTISFILGDLLVWCASGKSDILLELSQAITQDSSQVIISDKACFLLQLFKTFNNSHLPELCLDLCKNA